MVAERAQNLKKVLDAVPSGYLVDAAWLTAHGIAYETFRDYVKRGWLERLKRLFFVFADRHDHPWRKRLDPAEFNLGRGDRALVKGGRIHPRYRIVVPEEFVATGAGDGA